MMRQRSLQARPTQLVPPTAPSPSYHRATTFPPTRYDPRTPYHRTQAPNPNLIASSSTLPTFPSSSGEKLARGHLAQARFHEGIQAAGGLISPPKPVTTFGAPTGKVGARAGRAPEMTQAAADAALLIAKSNVTLPRPPAHNPNAMW